jgi:DNA repair exonuclease SbcCD ATPase subunit
LKTRHAELKEELAAVAVDESTLADVREERERLEREKRDLETFTNDLAVVLDVNTDLLQGEYEEMATQTEVTAALDPASKTVECWTCGSEVRREEIRDRLDSLRDLLQEKRSRRDEIDDRLSELADRAADIERESRRRDQLETDLADVEAELDFRRDRVGELQDSIDELESDLQALEEAIETADAGGESRDESPYRRLSELEYERGRLAEERSAIESDIAEIERLVEEERPAVVTRIETVTEEIESLRGRVASIERDVIETFDEHMNELLDRLHYRNVERVWLERRHGEESGTDEASEFVLHVVRQGPAGTVYEDTVETLSESERELIGIVIALSGYLVHDVGERIPFVLLDSVEAIDAERLSTILEYLGEHVTFLLAAVLPEEAAALPAEYTRVSASALQ